MVEIIERQNDDIVDKLEAGLAVHFPPVTCPLWHTFTPGLYTRKILMPKGTMVTSAIHITEHQFAVLTGAISVSIDGAESQMFFAGDSGITKIGTRRVLYAHEDCMWITMHPTDVMPEDESEESILKAVAKIEDKILEKRENKLLTKIKEDALCLSQS